MNQSFLSVNTLLDWRLRTTDGLTAGLRDLLFDRDSWTARLLVAEAEGWAPERELLIAPRMVTGYDPARAELDLDVDAEMLASSPALVMEDGLAGFGDEAALPPDWQAHWRAEMNPEDVVDPPPAPTDELESEVAADLGAETDLSADDVLRAETLLGWSAETTDGLSLAINDLVLDDRDWALAYLRVALGEESDLSCLVPKESIDSLNRQEETLYLAVRVQALRTAPAQPSPVALDERSRVRVYSDS